MAFPGQWTAGQRIGSMMWVHWFFINRWSHRWPLDTKVLLNTFYLCCRRTHVMSHKLWYESLGHRVVTKLWNYFFISCIFPLFDQVQSPAWLDTEHIRPLTQMWVAMRSISYTHLAVLTLNKLNTQPIVTTTTRCYCGSWRKAEIHGSEYLPKGKKILSLVNNKPLF